MNNIYILDSSQINNQENIAMLQTLYSRSHSSVIENLEKVKEVGSDKFLDNYLISYGHKSIADCAFTNIFIENVSFLAAKIIQDNNLYNGTECSSRYLDFNKTNIFIPNKNYSNIVIELMNFYKENFDIVYDSIYNLDVFKDYNDFEVNKIRYKNAAKAKTFDILRGFLPIGCLTKLSWATNLRQAYDHTLRLKTNKLPEIQSIGNTILNLLIEKYPHSFNYKESEEKINYLNTINYFEQYNFKDNLKLDFSNFNFENLYKYKEIIENRPINTELPKILNSLGTIKIFFTLDYGSYRDLQRHRGGSNNLPIVTSEFGFNSLYLHYLPKNLKDKALKLITETLNSIEKLPISIEEKQYYFPLGTNIKSCYTCSLSQLVYICELRSKETVHFTLRDIILKIIPELKLRIPNLKLYCDDSPIFSLSLKRGTQDIKSIS